MARYAEAIEYDLRAHHRLSVGDLWVVPQRWRELLNLIERLPAHCQWRHEQYNDPDFAQAMVEAFPEPPEPSPPGWSEWSPVLDALAGVNDRLSVLIATKGDGKTPPKMQARPVTEFQRAREGVKKRSAREDHDFLMSALLRGRPSAAGEELAE